MSLDDGDRSSNWNKTGVGDDASESESGMRTAAASSRYRGSERDARDVSYMYGPRSSLPDGTSLLSAWDGDAADVEQRIALVVAPATNAGHSRKRGWRHLKLYSDVSGDYTRDYVSADERMSRLSMSSPDAMAPSPFLERRDGRSPTADPG